MESAGYPFCEVEFFDRFVVNKTILFLRFLVEAIEKTEPILDSKKGKRKCLVEREIVGSYQGHAGKDAIRLKGELGVVDVIPTRSETTRRFFFNNEVE